MGPERIMPPEIAEEAAKFELEQHKGLQDTDKTSPGAIDPSDAEGKGQDENSSTRFNELFKQRQQLEGQINVLKYGEQTKYGFNHDNPRELSDTEKTQLANLEQQETAVNEEFQKVRIARDAASLQEEASQRQNESNTNANGEGDISLYGPLVDEAMYKVRVAEANGDTDEIREARAHYDSVLKDNQERGRETREHMREFDDQMSGR